MARKQVYRSDEERLRLFKEKVTKYEEKLVPKNAWRASRIVLNLERAKKYAIKMGKKEVAASIEALLVVMRPLAVEGEVEVEEAPTSTSGPVVGKTI